LQRIKLKGLNPPLTLAQVVCDDAGVLVASGHHCACSMLTDRVSILTGGGGGLPLLIYLEKDGLGIAIGLGQFVPLTWDEWPLDFF